MNEQIKTFVTQFVGDLVNQGILAKEVDGKWTLIKPVLGYGSDVTFQTKDEAIQKLAAGAMARYSVTGLHQAAS